MKSKLLLFSLFFFSLTTTSPFSVHPCLSYFIISVMFLSLWVLFHHLSWLISTYSVLYICRCLVSSLFCLFIVWGSPSHSFCLYVCTGSFSCSYVCIGSSPVLRSVSAHLLFLCLYRLVSCSYVCFVCIGSFLCSYVCTDSFLCSYVSTGSFSCSCVCLVSKTVLFLFCP